MPQNLSLENGYSAAVTLDRDGWTVPWEVSGYQEDAIQARTGGFFDFSDWGVVEISGPDARDYLNRMTTLNFKTLPAGRASHGAFLTGKAHVVALGWFVTEATHFEFWVTPPQVTSAVEHIEKFHFAEDFKTTDLSADWALLGVYGVESLPKLGLKTEGLEIAKASVGPVAVQFWADEQISGLTWLRLKRSDAPALFKTFQQKGLPLLGGHYFEYLRLKAAVPRVGQEIKGSEILLETGFEAAVARNKGCYPGQEVIERIFTYGQVNKKLLPVTLELAGESPKTPFALLEDGKNVGEVVNWEKDPLKDGQGVGLAYIHRSQWESKHAFQTPFGAFRGTITAK